jgi:UDP-N-acetylmuramoyl-tripeptide--D-alanyl-D-alanine ligase
MKFDLVQLAQVLGATVVPPAALATGWSIDSRTVVPGDLFFALRGEHSDGHAYLGDVFARGAVAAVVDRDVAVSGTILRVPDSLAALQALARWARQSWGGRVVAVTGSAGKTTTKDVIADLLSVAGPTGKTVGNFNNHIGLPLSILRLPEDATAAVLEMGMNHAGELRQLAGIARPDVGVVTNVGYAHVEYFGSIENTALAKRELIESLEPDGTAVLNADDPLVARFREVHPGPVITFGFSAGADVRAEDAGFLADRAFFRALGVRFESPLAGRHGILNVLAGLAVARAFGIAPERLVDAVASLSPGAMRGERLRVRDMVIWNDCYNANPEAVRSMLDVLAAESGRRRIAVLGEMLELGAWSAALHRDVGRYAAGRGIDVLVAVKGNARQVLKGALEAGFPADHALFFEDPIAAGDYLCGAATAGDVILIKGSRGTRMELALERILA